MAAKSRRHVLSIAVARALADPVTAPHDRDLRESTLSGRTNFSDADIAVNDRYPERPHSGVNTYPPLSHC